MGEFVRGSTVVQGFMDKPAQLHDLRENASFFGSPSAFGRPPFRRRRPALLCGPVGGCSVRDAIGSTSLKRDHDPMATGGHLDIATALPAAPTSLVGRAREGAEIAALLRGDAGPDGVRLLTLTGPGGVGKTRLALRVAHAVAPAFADGVAFVPLAPVRDPSHVVSTVAQAVGIRETGGTPVAERLAVVLRSRAMLLVLDNFEQVVEAAPAIADLLAACPRLKVLVTSRVTLRVSGEHVYAVPPLDTPEPGASVSSDEQAADAVRLFVDRATAADRRFTLTDANAPTVAAICRRLDGLPLAIELAAARAAMLSPAALLLRLERRLPLLTGGPRDAPPRLRTMRDAIAWSHDLLGHAEQVLFRRLAVFVGGFTLDAAEAVATAPGPLEIEPFEGVSALIGASLVTRLGPPDGVPDLGVPRFGMLETIREFGLEQLEAVGEAGTVRRAHAAWFATLAGADAPMDLRWRAASWLDRTEAERENLRAALAWAEAEGDAEFNLALASALWWFWWVRGPVGEGRGWLTHALSRGGEVAPRVRAAALYAAAVLANLQSDYDRVAALAGEGEALFRACGDRVGTVFALLVLGASPQDHEDHGQVAAILADGVAIAREEGQSWLLTIALNNLASAVGALGDHAEVERLADEALRLAREDGDPWGMAYALGNLGGAARELGDHERALTLFAESLRLARGEGNNRYVADALVGFATIAVAHGQTGAAARLLGTADALCDAVGSPVFPHEVQYARAVDMVRTALGSDAFAAERAVGFGRSLDEAVEEATDLAASPAPRATARRGPPPELTAREFDVLRLLVAGKSNPEIAEALFVSPRTVSTHLTRIFAKLGVAGRAEASALAVRRGLA